MSEVALAFFFGYILAVVVGYIGAYVGTILRKKP